MSTRRNEILAKMLIRILFCTVLLGCIYLLQYLIVYNPISSFTHGQQQKWALSRIDKEELKEFTPVIESRACKSFVYDVSEWTIQYWQLNKTIEDKKCKNISEELLKGRTLNIYCNVFFALIAKKLFFFKYLLHRLLR